MSTLASTLTTQFPEFAFQTNYPLADQTYFKLGGPAEVYLSIQDPNKLASLISYCHEHQIKVTMWGGASNIIVSDNGIAGLVIHYTNDQFTLLGKTIDGKQLFQAGAGIKTALLVKASLDAGLQGLEYFLGVPGTLGGATYNNAHYLQNLIGNFIHRVQVITPKGELIWLEHDECGFEYDDSRFQSTDEVIVTVEFALLPGDRESSLAKVKEATQYRAATQPLGEASSGCIFQNVPNSPELRQLFPQFSQQSFISGGFIIEQAGLKGARQGNIEVSQKHAAFFVNKGGGTAQDVKTLIETVKSTVHKKFNITLEEEVFYID